MQNRPRHLMISNVFAKFKENFAENRILALTKLFPQCLLVDFVFQSLEISSCCVGDIIQRDGGPLTPKE